MKFSYFSLFYITVNWKSLGLGLFIGQKKAFENVTSGNWGGHFSLISENVLVEQVID